MNLSSRLLTHKIRQYEIQDTTIKAYKPQVKILKRNPNSNGSNTPVNRTASPASSLPSRHGSTEGLNKVVAPSSGSGSSTPHSAPPAREELSVRELKYQKAREKYFGPDTSEDEVRNDTTLESAENSEKPRPVTAGETSLSSSSSPSIRPATSPSVSNLSATDLSNRSGTSTPANSTFTKNDSPGSLLSNTRLSLGNLSISGSNSSISGNNPAYQRSQISTPSIHPSEYHEYSRSTNYSVQPKQHNQQFSAGYHGSDDMNDMSHLGNMAYQPYGVPQQQQYPGGGPGQQIPPMMMGQNSQMQSLGYPYYGSPAGLMPYGGVPNSIPSNDLGLTMGMGVPGSANMINSQQQQPYPQNVNTNNINNPGFNNNNYYNHPRQGNNLKPLQNNGYQGPNQQFNRYNNNGINSNNYNRNGSYNNNYKKHNFNHNGQNSNLSGNNYSNNNGNYNKGYQHRNYNNHNNYNGGYQRNKYNNNGNNQTPGTFNNYNNNRNNYTNRQQYNYNNGTSGSEDASSGDVTNAYSQLDSYEKSPNNSNYQGGYKNYNNNVDYNYNSNGGSWNNTGEGSGNDTKKRGGYYNTNQGKNLESNSTDSPEDGYNSKPNLQGEE